MSRLDDRLRDILATPAAPVDYLVDRIKQAFADEGYVQVPQEVQDIWREYNRMAGFMTGSEWYERFVEQLKLESPDLNKADAINALLAAKRAARLTDD